MNKSKIMMAFFVFSSVAVIALSILLLHSIGSDIRKKSSSGESEVSTHPGTDYNSSKEKDDLEVPEPETIKSETFISYIGKEKKNINKEIFKEDGNNQYKLLLSGLLSANDNVESFVFHIKSSDGSFINNYRTSIGVNVISELNGGSNWYKGADMYFDGLEAETDITAEIPDTIKGIIDPKGHVMFGHWASETDSVILTDVYCQKKKMQEIEYNGTVSLDVDLKMDKDDNPSYTFLASDFIKNDNSYLNTINFHVTGTSDTDRISFDLSLKDQNGIVHNEKNNFQFCDSHQTDIMWIIPENLLKRADNHSIITFTYKDSQSDTINIDNISVTYSNK